MRSFIHSFILMAVVLVPARAALAEAAPQKTVIFEGTGADALACGPVLGIAPNGNWLCAWLGGGRAEPKPENKTVVAISADGGVT